MASPTLPLIDKSATAPGPNISICPCRAGRLDRCSAGVGRRLWRPDRGLTDTVNSIDHDASFDESQEGGDVEHFGGNVMENIISAYFV